MTTDFDAYHCAEISSFGALDVDEKERLYVLLEDARKYIGKFRWCGKVEEEYFGMGVGGIFAIFLLKVENASSPEDSLLWVIVGDIPPAYLVALDGPETPEEALSTYIDLMGEWVAAVEGGLPVGDLIPVNVPPTPKFARMLKSRLEHLRANFLPDFN